jgi:tRNA/rRNA methyltransferase
MNTEISRFPFSTTFILVEPQVPENVGFICRALKNMGFASLRVVGSSYQNNKAAQKTAYEAHDILENIQNFENLDEAIRDLDLVIGTSAKERKNRNEWIPIDQLGNFLSDKTDMVTNIGVVFGSESNGLSQQDERKCHVLSTIPMATHYPSINLSHSVMIYAYELSRITIKNEHIPIERKITYSVYDQRIREFLDELPLHERQPELYQRTLDKLRKVPSADIPLILSLLRYLKKH